MTEIIFWVEEDTEGGYTARANPHIAGQQQNWSRLRNRSTNGWIGQTLVLLALKEKF
jgi:hypothetical protein